MNIFEWLEDWYVSQCDGNWEHHYGIRIETLDNPGWLVKIDLNNTELKNLVIEYKLHEFSENNWHAVSIKDSLYIGAGDPKKLEFLIAEFKKIVENGNGG